MLYICMLGLVQVQDTELFTDNYFGPISISGLFR